jgi:hypothetical protein
MIMLSEVRSRQTTDWMGDMDEIASTQRQIASLGNPWRASHAESTDGPRQPQ